MGGTVILARARSCGVYRWKDNAIVVPQLETKDGIGLEGTPILVENPASQYLLLAIGEALSGSKKGVPDPPCDYRWPMLDITGVRSEREFYRIASDRYLIIRKARKETIVSLWVKADDGKGYVPSGEADQIVPANDRSRLVDMILSSLLFK